MVEATTRGMSYMAHDISPASFVVDRVGTNLIKRIMNY